MTRIASALITPALLLAMIGASQSAQAQLARTFVSSSGNDLNNCDRLTPCRTFQHAHDQTLANGEITVLDPGGYGALTINRTISIVNDGVGEAGALVSGGVTGITINGAATDVVNLRGLTVKGIGFGGGNGIVFNSGKSLTVENCAIRNLTGGPSLPLGRGLLYQPNGSSALAVTNTFVADNFVGIFVQPTGASSTVNVVLKRVQAHNNTTSGIIISGTAATGAVNATIADSVADSNGNTGLLSGSGGGAVTTVLLIRSVVMGNSFGVSALGANATVYLGASTITGNGEGLNTPLTDYISFGDNNIDGNSGGNGPLLLIAKK